MPTDEQLLEKVKADWQGHINAIDDILRNEISQVQTEAGKKLFDPKEKAIPEAEDFVLPATHEELINFLQKPNIPAVREILRGLNPAPKDEAIDSFIRKMTTYPRLTKIEVYDSAIESVRERFISGLNDLRQRVTSQITADGPKRIPLPTSVRRELESILDYAKVYRDYLVESRPRELNFTISDNVWIDLVKNTDSFLADQGIESQRQRNLKGAKIMALLYPDTWGKAETESTFKPAFNRFDYLLRSKK